MPIQIRKKGVKGQPGTPTTQYGEIKKPVQITLTPTAIASLDQLAKSQNPPISRSELVERYARKCQLFETLLDAVEDVLYDGQSTDECLPPHPSYEVSGDAFRKLGDAFTAIMEANDNS